MKVKVKAPIALNKKLAKATLFVSTSTDAAAKGSYSELYGCRWEPKKSVGTCASAVGNKSLKEWHDSTFDKSVKITKIPGLWQVGKAELFKDAMAFQTSRNYD